MKFVLHNVIPHYIEHDILQSSGRKIHDSYYCIEYFDFVMNGQKEFIIPDGCPELYKQLFLILKKYAKKNKTLEEQSSYLFMKESYDTCTLLLHAIDSTTKKPCTLFRTIFPKIEWANIEDFLLIAGLAVCKQSEKRTLKYELPVFDSRYELIIEGENNMLTLFAPDEDKLIDSLTVIGHTVDEGKLEE
ncbi:hypothetical protein CO051_02660 [Candidatus Roizmanbacteria bacterium CG_4_9_14_0_2_um_filter_39_13]|uniref:Uncharacterized protein n=2 Tax=Candidatus Roizmaniibacteriota TaxID=1752723 RepID=A0A2M8F0B3_9BACT|nr:MAG: hypothetical protein CO051_02660 [Candidatus Roizmanbacteria bacterium CG_4_9_14_0_2_um_filter_39_13]PJE62218.1 MAG: hypothetical protein COU87_00540 [Candidatus Roizmanbacteria bacterium CG10_big_fil_rev_8_21_14_0_10_39_12]